MGLFGGSSDRGELLELQTRVGRLEEQVARLSAALAATQSGGPAPVESAAALDQYAEARALASSGHKIEAIKVVREQSGLSLKAAKDLVESWVSSWSSAFGGGVSATLENEADPTLENEATGPLRSSLPCLGF